MGHFVAEACVALALVADAVLQGTLQISLHLVGSHLSAATANADVRKKTAVSAMIVALRMR